MKLYLRKKLSVVFVFVMILFYTEGQVFSMGDSALDDKNLSERMIVSGTSDMGSVIVAIMYEGFDNGALTFSVSMDTHSVDLGKIDLKENAYLLVGDSKIYPSNEPKFSGHHGFDSLEFEVDAKPDEVILYILKVPSIEERVFTW